MREATKFEQKFPKFLIGDSADERTFVIHLHHPRFVGEVIEEYAIGVRIEPEFIDSPEDDPASLAALMREAGEFYNGEIEREE